MRHGYEWALLRVVPRMDRGECVNVGALVYCQGLDFLDAGVSVDPARLTALDPDIDVAGVERHLAAVVALCAGSPRTGPSGARSRGDRFRWLTAPRSTVVQPSPVHTGMTADPAAELRRIVATLVRQPPSVRGS